MTQYKPSFSSRGTKNLVHDPWRIFLSHLFFCPHFFGARCNLTQQMVDRKIKGQKNDGRREVWLSL